MPGLLGRVCGWTVLFAVIIATAVCNLALLIHFGTVQWFAPFFSGGGYSSEAISYIQELRKWLHLGIEQHGDSINAQFVNGLPVELQRTLAELRLTTLDPARTVQVCHSEPGAWSAPFPLYHTTRCPGSDSLYSIGRTMFETDRLPAGWLSRLQALDEIWVPTEFHRHVFEAGGVGAERLQVIPEAVDVDLFDASRHSPLDQLRRDPRFKFLSIFKWETRKGWDVLLSAFLSEFSARDNHTALYIRTDPYHSDGNFRGKMEAFAREKLGLGREALEHIVILETALPLDQLPRLYKGADAFVLPSRGEGWGRPHVEAMAMGLPVIATNWSGNTEFMNAHNSFLIPILGLEPIGDGPFQGHMWASPSVQGLRAIMRQVVADPQAARDVGQKGSYEIRTKYNPAAVARVVLLRLEKIQGKLVARGLLN